MWLWEGNPAHPSCSEHQECAMKTGAFLGGFRYDIFQASLLKVSAWLMAMALVAGLVLVLVCRARKVA